MSPGRSGLSFGTSPSRLVLPMRRPPFTPPPPSRQNMEFPQWSRPGVPWLGGNVEGFAGLIAGHHFVRLPLEFPHRIELAASVHFMAKLVEMREQVAAVIKPLHGQRIGDSQVIDLKLLGVGVPFGLKRVVL